jgi:PadR family transcriptional regulator, regulatory protein AphA
MKRKAGTTEYAVLGMLGWGPASGYDLKKRFEGSVAHFWSESYGQIYPILARLASEGMVERRLERQKGKPDRYVYSITSEGQERLGAWLAEPAREQGFRSELLLKLFFGRRRPVEDSIRHVERFRERQQALLRGYADGERALLRNHRTHSELPYWLMTLRFGASRATALLRWSEETLRTLERLSRAPVRRAKAR